MIILSKKIKSFNFRFIKKFYLNNGNRKYFILILSILIFYIPSLRIKYSSFPIILRHAIENTLGKNSLIFAHLNYESSLYGNAYRFIKANFKEEDKIYLSLDFKSMSDLQKEIDQSIKRGYINLFSKKEVNGEIKYRNKIIPVTLRLKGDNIDHLKSDKWSIRIKGKRGATILGMREFSLQHPRVRNYFGEFIYHLFLRNEGLPFLRYEFKTLILNGKNLGSYAIEEHFDKRLLENSKFREGPIIKLSEQNMWIELEKRYQVFNKRLQTKEIQKGEMFAEVVPFNINKLYQNKIKYNQFLRARNLLHKYLLGEIEMDDVFDIELTAKYFAINDLLLVSHASAWNNIRFYYNPITGKLIPIGYDADVTIKNNSFEYPQLSIDRNSFNLFDNQIFLSQYINFLEKYSEPEYLEKTLIKNNKDIKNNLINIQRYYPFVRLLSDELSKNQQYIKSRLNPSEPIIARIKEINKDKIKIDFANRYNFPIEIISVYKDGYLYPTPKNNLITKNNTKRFKYKLLNFSNPVVSKEKYKTNNLIIKYRLLGSKKTFIKDINISEKDTLDNQKLNFNLRKQKNNFKNSKILDIDFVNKTVNIKKGKWTIDKPIIFPKGFTLNANKGTEINFINNSYILLKGKISLIGTENEPIKITSNNTSGSLIIIEAKDKSILKNVVFSNLKLPYFPDLGITGNITFYNSPVKISNCSFLNLNAEDSLNVIGSTLELNNSYFKGSFSDALDLDFVKAKIKNVYFENIGNDAIDVSGSEVDANNIFISGAQDKGISVGEKSIFSITNVSVFQTNIAFASKDLSVLNLSNLYIKNNGLCLAAFKKKDEYGPGIINVLDDSLNDRLLELECKKTYLLELESEIKNKDKLFNVNSSNVYDQLYGNKFGKKTIK